MRALLRISWREVREGFTKFLLTLLSVSLGVAFLTGTLALRDTLADTFNSIVTASITNDVYVRGQKIDKDDVSDETRHALDLNLEGKIRTVVGPRALVEPEISVQTVSIENAEGKVISNSGAPTILLPYYDHELSDPITEGRAPRGPHEIALISNVFKSSGLKVGDTTTLTINGAKRTVTIVGSVKYDQTTFGAVVLFMERDVVEPIALPDVKKVSQIGVDLPDGTDRNEAIKAIAKVVPANAVVVDGSVLKREAEEKIDTQLGFINTFLLVFVFIALFVGSFVIGNTFAMTVRQRMKQFAMLRAIGTRPGGIFFLVLIQAIVIGFLGSLLGLVLGMGILLAVGMLFNGMGLTLATPTMSSTIMATGILVGVLVTVGGALISARRAALTNPLEVLRDAQGGDRQGFTKRNWFALALLILGVVACTMGASSADLPTIGVGAVLVILGTLGSLAFLTGPIVRFGTRILRPFGKVETSLAAGNIMRNRSRTAATAGALLIGVALVAAGSMLTATVKGSTASIMSNSFKADLMVVSQSGKLFPRNDVQRIRDVDGVAGTKSIYLSYISVTHDDAKSRPMVLFVDPEISTYRSETLIEGDSGALSDGKLVINRARLGSKEKDLYKIGDEVTLESAYGKKVAKVGAIVDAQALDTVHILPEAWLTDLAPEARDPLAVDIKIEDDADLETVKNEINSLFDKDSPFKAKDPEEVTGQAGEQLDMVLGVLYALIGLSVITAVFGIINTLALSVMDRTREIGMIQAIGMKRREVIRMITMEGLLITLLGVVVGLGVGLGLAWALAMGLRDTGISGVIFPWGTIVAVIIGAIVIGVGAAVIPARNASKINVLSAMAE